jgi:hypothetical protein
VANIISKTDRYAYIRYAADSLVYAQLVRQFAGNDNLALRQLRLRFDAALARLVSDTAQNPERQRIL